MTTFQLTPLLLVNDARSPLSAVSPLSANSSAKKRKWSHDILSSSSTSSSTTASPTQTFRSLSLRPSTASNGDEADDGSDTESMDGGKRSRADDRDSSVRWVRIQVEQDGGPSVVVHTSPPSSHATASSYPRYSEAASAAGSSRLPPALESKTSSQPITLAVSSSNALSVSPPARPRASTTPVTPTTARVTSLAAATHIKAADYHAFINSLPSATKKHNRRRPRSGHSSAAVAPTSQAPPAFGPPLPSARIQFTLPSVVLARKAAALAARGGQVTVVNSPYAMPSPPPLTPSQPATPLSHKEERLADSSLMRSYASFASLPSASPVSSISAFSCPSSSPQSVSSSSVTSPTFGAYPFTNLSLASSTSSISSLPSFGRRFSVPSITSSLQMSPLAVAASSKPPLTRTRSSIHLRHPAIAKRMNKPGGRWRKLQTALRLNRRWQTYRQPMADGGHAGQSNDQDRSLEADSGGEDEEDMDVDDDDIIDEEDDEAVTEEDADSGGTAAVSSSSPYNPYAADNRVFVTARPPPPPLQLPQSVDARGLSPSPSSSASATSSRKRPSQLASRRHTNPTNSSSSLLTIASSYIQSKRVPNSPSPHPLPLSPNSPMSPAPKSPSSASFHSRHISMMSSQRGSTPTTPITATRSLSSLSNGSSNSASASSSLSSTTSSAGIFIDQFALCLTLQFCDLRTLLHCRRISWLWYEHASSPLSWLSSRYRLLVAEEGAEQTDVVPLPNFAAHLPVAMPSVPRFHALTSAFCDTLAVSMRYLRALDISSLPTGINVQSLSSLLSAVPFLHTLSLSYNPWLTDGHLQLLPAQLPRLRYLDVSSCPLINRDGIAPLAQLALLSLDLSSSSLTDDDIDVLAPMTSLLSLNLSCNKHLTSDCMEWLCAAMPQLLILDTSWTTIISASPPVHPQPRSPLINGLSSPTSLLASVAQLSSLLILNLSYSKHLDDDMLRSVRCCHALHTLDLFSCQEVTDQGLRWLCGAGDDMEQRQHEEQQSGSKDEVERRRESDVNGGDGEQRESRGTQPNSPTSFPINFAFASPRLLQSAPPSPPLLSSSRGSSIGTLALPLSSFTLSSRPASPVLPRRVLSAASTGASSSSTPGRSSLASSTALSTSCPLPSLASLSIGAIPLLSSSAIGTCLPLLPSLIAVDLQFTRVDDATLVRLIEGWRRRADRRQAVMRSVQCSWCRFVTEEGRERMREQLPHCAVN